MNPLVEQRRAFYEARPTERRLTGLLETRFVDPTGDAPATLGLTGYAATTGQPYAVRDFLGEYQEVITPGAFTKALQERDDVRLLLNHEGIPLARTKSGTMTLTEDATGLRVDVPSLDVESPLVQSVRSAMQRGDMDQMSFAFRATRQEWNEDYSERYVNEVALYDVSVVTYPANGTTSAKLRSAGLPFATIDRLSRGLALTEDDETALRALLAKHEEEPAGETVPDLSARERRLAQLRAVLGSV